jgi:hypothetical protein
MGQTRLHRGPRRALPVPRRCRRVRAGSLSEERGCEREGAHTPKRGGDGARQGRCRRIGHRTGRVEPRARASSLGPHETIHPNPCNLFQLMRQSGLRSAHLMTPRPDSETRASAELSGAWRRDSGGTGFWSHSYHYLRTYHWTGRDGAARSRPARPRENANTTLFAVDIRFVLGLCKSLLFVRSARGSAGRSEVNTPYGNLTNANAVTLEAALSVPARSDCECGAREASDPRLERETSSDPYAR